MLDPRLPDYAPPYVPPRDSLSRPSAQSLRNTTPTTTDLSLSLAGYDELLPLLYGEDRVPGLWLVRPYSDLGSGNMRFALAWCWGEIEGVQTVYINGQAVDSGDMTHYDGTSGQTADSMLSTDIAGFADAYPDCAYTVFDIPVETYGGFPQTHQIEAVVRGRLCFDPRDSSTAWTENPALQMADWIEAGGQISPGLTAYGVADAANYCDEVVAGSFIRCESAVTITQGRTVSEILDLFSAYAECLWSYSGDGVLMVPDAPVEAPAAVLTESEIFNYRALGAESLRSPTVVNLTYRDPTGTEEQWPQKTEPQKIPGVDSGEIAEIPSDITLLGVHRSSEASSKALKRLRRVRNSGGHAWQATDEGIRFERGDVVQLPNIKGLVDALCRILSVEMIEPGYYQITAEHYSADMYPDDFVPGSEVQVPVGGIVWFTGSTIPSGWARFTDADDRFLVGASSSLAAGTTDGSTSFTVSGNTNMAGGHTGDSTISGEAWAIGQPSAQSGDPFVDGATTAEPNHNHSYSRSSTVTPQYRREILIEKTGTVGDLPQDAMVMADGQLISSALSEVSTSLGRMQQAGDSATGGTASSFSFSLGTTHISNEPDHDHGPRRVTGDTSSTFTPAYEHVAAGGHDHTASLTITLNPKRLKMAFYLASADTEIIPGAVIGFDPALSLPSGWVEFAEVEERYIERSTPASAGEELGNNTLSWTGNTNTAPDHDHQGALQGNRSAYNAYHPNGEGAHSHTLSGSTGYIPPRYAMRFIQYTGAV